MDPHSWLGGISCLYLLPCLPLFHMLTCCTSFFRPRSMDRVGGSVPQYLILMATYRCASHKQNHCTSERFVCAAWKPFYPQRQKCSVRVFTYTKCLCRHAWACEHAYMCRMFTYISFLCIFILLLCSPCGGADAFQPKSAFYRI